MRRFLVMILIMALTFNNFSLRSSAEVTGTFGKGTWSESQQGMRFSIYDLESAETISVLDAFSEPSMAAFNSAKKRGSFAHAIGCKLDYLYQADHIKGNNLTKLTEISIKYFTDLTYSYISKGFQPEENGEMQKYLRPIVMMDSTKWKAPQYIKELLKDDDQAVIDNILHLLGFYIYKEPNDGLDVEKFTDRYVLVVEPVYFFDIYVKSISEENRMMFYGTATEYAIFDTQLQLNPYTKSITTGYYSGTIHDTMCNLTIFAGPASVLTPSTQTFELGTGESITITESPKDAKKFFDTYHYGNRGTYEADVNMDIIKKFGVDTLQAKDLKGLTININETNRNFHCGTNGVVSFKMLSTSNEDILKEKDERYEFKLKLEPLEGSVITETVVLRSNGLPKADEERNYSDTYVFGDFKCPNREGVWRFKVDLYQNEEGSDEMISYFSDNGEALDDGTYAFSINIKKLDYETPPDTHADSLRPKGFTPPSAYETAQSLSSVTSLSWHYYTVTYGKDEDGNEIKKPRLVQKTAEANLGTINGAYSYANIPQRNDGNGNLVSRSGYGVGLYLPAGSLEGNYAENYQNGLVNYPEFNYALYSRTVELNDRDVYQLAKNPSSTYYNDSLHSDYSRVHFTPVWYPDGEYPIIVTMFDNWTPAGELFDFRVYTVTMKGSIYDDWHIVRK